MARKELLRRASADEIRRMIAATGDQSDWDAARAMPQADIERLADEEEGSLPAGWEDAVEIGIPIRKQAVHIRLDADVLAWFRDRGPGYQTRINTVLRSFVQHHRQAEGAKPKRR